MYTHCAAQRIPATAVFVFILEEVILLLLLCSVLALNKGLVFHIKNRSYIKREGLLLRLVLSLDPDADKLAWGRFYSSA